MKGYIRFFIQHSTLGCFRVKLQNLLFFLLFYKPTLMFTKTVIYCLQTYLYLLKYESIQNLFQEKLHWHTCSTQTYLPCFLLSMKLWWTIISSYTKMAFVSVALLQVTWKFNLHFLCISIECSFFYAAIHKTTSGSDEYWS